MQRKNRSKKRYYKKVYIIIHFPIIMAQATNMDPRITKGPVTDLVTSIDQVVNLGFVHIEQKGYDQEGGDFQLGSHFLHVNSILGYEVTRKVRQRFIERHSGQSLDNHFE